MSTDEKRVREFAYQIWESEGQPQGQEARHWEMARKLAEAEALAPAKPVKTPKAKAPPATKTKAKAGAAQVVTPPGEKASPRKSPAPRANRPVDPRQRLRQPHRPPQVDAGHALQEFL
ncbi:DUF2934 domain-containing protein [Pseudomonas kielensis]|nr:DUF2934 domain-containing protein [Pseudomonas kielensis]UZM15604.1 DUF2934 domain-containing protein [Pseudomonas kielensis]